MNWQSSCLILVAISLSFTNVMCIPHVKSLPKYSFLIQLQLSLLTIKYNQPATNIVLLPPPPPKLFSLLLLQSKKSQRPTRFYYNIPSPLHSTKLINQFINTSACRSDDGSSCNREAHEYLQSPPKRGLDH